MYCIYSSEPVIDFRTLGVTHPQMYCIYSEQVMEESVFIGVTNTKPQVIYSEAKIAKQTWQTSPKGRSVYCNSIAAQPKASTSSGGFEIRPQPSRGFAIPNKLKPHQLTNLNPCPTTSPP